MNNRLLDALNHPNGTSAQIGRVNLDPSNLAAYMVPSGGTIIMNPTYNVTMGISKEIEQALDVFRQLKVGENMDVSEPTLRKFLETKATPDEIREFSADVLTASVHALTNRDFTKLIEELEAWSATAEIALDDTATNAIATGLAEIENGEFVEWNPGDFTE